MVTVAAHHIFTYEEYLQHERATGLKHEFLQGQIYAMARGTPEHARLIAAVTMALGPLVDLERCRVFSSDLKVRVRATGLATYPDIAIVCGDVEYDLEDPNAVTNPKVLFEVLSSSTEAYDRGEKWAHYRRLPSLEAYVLIAQAPERVEVYERQVDGDYVHRIAGRGEELKVSCLGGRLDVDAIYRRAL